jgi:hypothetical protein
VQEKKGGSGGKGKGEKFDGDDDSHASSDPDGILEILKPKPNQPKFTLKAKALHAYLPPSTRVFGEPAASTLKVPGENGQVEERHVHPGGYLPLTPLSSQPNEHLRSYETHQGTP